jgi:hypothetical protein
MFVYNKGKLIRTIVPITKEEFILRLTHVTSGMNIEVTYDINVQNSEKPYKVYREENGVYSIYEEFFRKGKTIKENFEEAILFFEDNIYKLMKEAPPVDDSQRPDPNQPKPETFNEVPVVGDIIRVGDKFGIVTDVIETKVTVKKMSKEEAMRILKNQQNALIATSIEDVEMAFGGGVEEATKKTKKNSSDTFAEYDTEIDKVVILRVKPPKQKQPEGEMPQPENDDQEPEPIPENVEDPFEENNDSEQNQDENQDESKDENKSKDDKGEDNKNENGKGEDSENENSEDGDSEDGDSEDRDSEDRNSEDGDSEDRDSGNKSGNSEGDDFGDEEEGEEGGKPTLEELMQKIQKEFEDGKSSSDIELKQDMEILEKALSTPKNQIKDTFKTKALALTAIGRANIFGTDNEKRLNEALNEIFK